MDFKFCIRCIYLICFLLFQCIYELLRVIQAHKHIWTCTRENIGNCLTSISASFYFKKWTVCSVWCLDLLWFCFYYPQMETTRHFNHLVDLTSLLEGVISLLLVQGIIWDNITVWEIVMGHFMPFHPPPSLVL